MQAPWKDRRVLAAVVLIGLILGAAGVRLATSAVPADGVRYRTMAASLVAGGGFHEEFVVRNSPQEGEIENGHTHYFSPLWPLLLVPFHLAGGGPWFDVAALLALATALTTAFLTSRDLWGDRAAFLTTTALGLALVRVSDQRGTEPLAAALYCIMLWSIFRSIQPLSEAWILLAGAVGALAYLTRASVGWLFLLGGGAGFAWRVAFHQRGALNRHYLSAIGLFGAGWAIWALRNLAGFWDGTLGGLPHAIAADAVFEHKFGVALQEPMRLLALIPVKLLWGLFLLSPLFLLRQRALVYQLRNLKDERQSGLFLAWAVPLFTGAIIAAIFTIADTAPPSPLWNLDNLRYFLFSIPGLLWGPKGADAPAASSSPAAARV